MDELVALQRRSIGIQKRSQRNVECLQINSLCYRPVVDQQMSLLRSHVKIHEDPTIDFCQEKQKHLKSGLDRFSCRKAFSIHEVSFKVIYA